MKTLILLYFSIATEFSLVSLTLANFNSETITTGNLKTWKSTTSDQNLEFWNFFVDNEAKAVNIDFPTPIEGHFGAKDNLYNTNIPEIESELGNQAMQEEKKIGEKSNRLNLPSIEQNMDNLRELVNPEREKRKFYLNSYNPSFRRHTHFSNFGRNLYQPDQYSDTYGNRDIDMRFMSRKRHPKILLLLNQDEKLEDVKPHYAEKSAFPKLFNQNGGSAEETVQSQKDVSSLSLFHNQDGRSAEENGLPYKVESVQFSTDIPLIPMPASANKLLNNLKFIALSPDEAAESSTIIKPSKESGIRKGFLKRSNLNFKNINNMESILNKIRTRSRNPENYHFKNQEMAKLNGPKSHKGKTYSDSEFWDFSTTDENEEKTDSPLHVSQQKFELNSPENDTKDGNLNNRLYDRVYYEKMPQNTNYSWFVFVNCSRDKCLLTNSTDETELRSEGWILHNCTRFGCTEIYPQIASMKKIIGLVLLVLGLCVLKITIFLLLFFYCRKMKLSKNAPCDPDVDQEKSIIGEKKSFKKNHDNDRNKEVMPGKFEETPSSQKEIDSSIARNKDKESDFLVVQQAKTVGSKVWEAPDQHISPCFINNASDKNILIHKKSFEKKVHGIKTSTIPKYKKSYRSNIPKFESWKRSDDRRTTKFETRTKAGRDLDRKTPKEVNATPGGDGDILLMNLDVVEDNGLCIPATAEKTSKWSTLLENECKSFVSIDLGQY